MRKEIIEIDKAKGVYRITTTDERFYTKADFDEESGLPLYKFVPSVTWITSFVPKGIEFYKWLASKGWDEAEVIKTEAGDRGTKIHRAIDILIQGGTIKMDDQFNNPSTEKTEDLTPDEYQAVNSFVQWYRDVKPEFILNETTVDSTIYGFAGTVDCVAKINGQVWIIDWKSSQYIWPSMEAQISAYKQAFKEMGRNVEGTKLAVLQLGYKRNKRGYKFTEIQDCFESVFKPAYQFWQNATKNISPKQYELPLFLKLKLENENQITIDEAIEIATTKVEVVKPKKPKKTRKELDKI